MGTFADEYAKLSEEQQGRIQEWVHLQRFIAHTLRMPFEKWVDDFVVPCMEKPLDYSFAEPVIGNYGGIDMGVSFSKGGDPALANVSRVPLRAKNNLGRLSPELQDQIAALLDQGSAEPVRLQGADVVMLQKIFPSEKALSRLKKPDFRKLSLRREGDEVVLALDGAADVMRASVAEFSQVMSRALV